MSIPDWAEEDRPREKLLAKGVDNLSDAELIAILIGSGNRNETAVELSKRILLGVDNNLNKLGKLNIPALMKYKGIGEAKAISIVAALELGRRRKLSEVLKKPKISDSEDVFNIFSAILSDLSHEEFWVLYLDRANQIMAKQKLSTGGVHGTIFDVKLVLRTAIEKLASGIILCHNHPSGNVTPSEADIEITKSLKQAAEYIQTTVLDHVIIADDKYYSFADKKIL